MIFRKIPRIFLLSAAFLLIVPNALSQTQQLSLVDIVTALRSKKATMEEKNRILTEGVNQRGVTFAFDESLEKELRNAGADESLISAIRRRAPAVKPVPAPQTVPTPAPTPVPVATPKPPDAAFYQNRGNSRFVLGEFDDAIADYTKAIELDPKQVTIFFSRGMAYLNKKNFNPAIADFDRVIELEPNEASAYYNRANALENTGNFEKALADYVKAGELEPDNDNAKTSAERLRAALPKPVERRDAPVIQSPVTGPVQSAPAEARTAPDASLPSNIGSLKDLALRLSVPTYPALERQNRTEGLVTVQVTIDEDGKVVNAKATNGPKGLRSASEDAARRSKFKPYTVEGKPVKATGYVVYNFKVS